MIKIDWDDEALEAAYRVLCNDDAPVSKVKIKYALDAALDVHNKKTRKVMNDRLIEKINELECRRDV